MNYWHVVQCNLSECHLPLFELLKKVQKNGRYTARQMYGCRGFVAHHNTDIHGDTAPQDTWYPGSYWVMGGAWLSTHLWSHYCYTQDREFLKEAFPIMAEAALFFVDFLIEKDGYLVTSPSVSPENTYILPNGEKGSCCIGATMDNQILRHLFGDCLSAWETLGEKEYDGCVIDGVEDISELMKQIRECRDRLMPDRISKSGRIMEWMEDYEEADPGHRHISHLYGLYPAGQITVDKTPELAAAARKTLEYRLSHGGGHTGWSRAWIMNHYASLWTEKPPMKILRRCWSCLHIPIFLTVIRPSRLTETLVPVQPCAGCWRRVIWRGWFCCLHCRRNGQTAVCGGSDWREMLSLICNGRMGNLSERKSVWKKIMTLLSYIMGKRKR